MRQRATEKPSAAFCGFSLAKFWKKMNCRRQELLKEAFAGGIGLCVRRSSHREALFKEKELFELTSAGVCAEVLKKSSQLLLLPSSQAAAPRRPRG